MFWKLNNIDSKNSYVMTISTKNWKERLIFNHLPLNHMCVYNEHVHINIEKSWNVCTASIYKQFTWRYLPIFGIWGITILFERFSAIFKGTKMTYKSIGYWKSYKLCTFLAEYIFVQECTDNNFFRFSAEFSYISSGAN